MPVYDTVGTPGGVIGGGNVTIDADGYTIIGDGIAVMPFKTTVTEIAANVFRFTRLVKHPTFGEIELEVTDVAVA